ncbi:hypothetical protein Pan44_53290 [Caulifigura coniformis]|uniref:Uncharacterized protein n=1 Tax=Caulifigura coniformis TaxID=2527983 RepID=A0A517SMA9_9PLAN|nr:hypothetical protein [Caulifigura coniformis]QDT57261.1 hypothetical protein Pan44_53290 [Caulifigura coniformis]
MISQEIQAAIDAAETACAGATDTQRVLVSSTVLKTLCEGAAGDESAWYADRAVRPSLIFVPGVDPVEAFASEVRELVAGARGKYPAFVTLSGATIRPLLNKVHVPMVRFKNTEPSRYKTLKEALSAVALRLRAIARVERQSATQSLTNPKTVRERLFSDGPEAFERMLKAAWDSVMSDGIATRQTYRAPTPGEDAVSIGFRVLYSDLGLDYATARELAF